MEDFSFVKENLNDVHKAIEKAVNNKERSVDEVTLINVSKTKPVEALMEAYTAGERHFGENKVQELVEKYEVMPKDIKWHMIGHLQTNKVKYIVDKVEYIHGVDSLKLAQVIDKEAQKHNIKVKILIEVNVAEEESKFGVTVAETENLVREIAKLNNVKVCGLMTIAPYVENSEDNRQYFVNLKELSVDIAAKNIDNVNMNVLSMGMTGDYGVAIEEGATFVRVGTGIFGRRNYV